MKRYLVSILLLLGGVSFAQEPADSLAPVGEAVEQPVPAVEALSPEQLWDQANTAYINDDFHTAADLYTQILDRGLCSARLYYNLGNACFKEDRLGEAILYYRRALRLAPGDDDARYNLSVAESRTKDNIERIPEFFLTSWMRSVRHAMSCSAWTLLSLAVLVCALASLLFYLLSQRIALRKAGFYGTLAMALLFVVTTCFAAGERREMLDRTQAVLMSVSASVKSSPDRTSTDLFVLHEGTVVEITDRLGEWCEIAIADGKKGWLESRKIEVI